MARPKSYNRAEVVDRVRDLFWKHGYQGLGIRAIEEETGLGRFAIRTEFGGKEGLMLEALASYTGDTDTYVHQVLRARDDTEAIVEILEGMVTPHPETMRHLGCLMVNTSVENAALDSGPLREATNKHFDTLRDEVAALLIRGRAHGKVRIDVDPASGAEFVKGAVIAAMVLNRAAGDASGGAGFISEAVRTVRGWAETGQAELLGEAANTSH
ncbi:TetR/AcrR family transcriptional regulator [Sulfitobacter sp. M368]|uniref:TetR/AcrR family transcriptional regulator n=1 Tax=Sulfitobacter sp. M368 TaxID=2867021 RepID=UPI0021A8C586|nr:TetR/AcrR family transcriptional regulator [Sulfitobacter sp. M368]UWR14897.1 TetR/AcrR family transcriptional regulator [Sulfitobacter sp. M368]